MEVDCEGCAGCCVDWRALAPEVADPERAGDRRPLDDAHNLVPLEREEVRAFLEAGFGDALVPRCWTLPAADGRDGAADAADDGPDSAADAPHEPVEVDGRHLAAVDGRPVFYVGLRTPPKPVAPVGREDAVWLPTCAFLDPETLQCRIHGGDLYPNACAAYPGYNLLLDQETECERVEAATGEERERLVDDAPPTDPPGVGLGPQALGAKLFAHPDPEDLAGRIDRLAAGEPSDEDRAAFVAVAAASAPGTLSVDERRRERAFERVLAADSWVGRAIAEWEERAGDADATAPGGEPADPGLGERVEERRGAPETPGWE